MRKWMSAFTLIELLVVIAIIAILAGMLLPILARAREEARRGVCSNQIGQLGKAQQAYMSTNGDFWSFQEHRVPTGNFYSYAGADDIEMPRTFMPRGDVRRYRDRQHNSNLSLSVLYPRWVDDINVFKCPSTTDQPIIGKWRAHHQGPLFSWFYTSGQTPRFLSGAYTMQAPMPDADLTDGRVWLGEPINPVQVTAFRNNQQHMTSYGYDDLKHFRNMLPGSARIADMRWMDQAGDVTHSNHGDDGHNVLYWDGSVQFRDTNYASVNPQDNIFRRETVWDDDAEAWVWRDDIENDAVIVRTFHDGLMHVQGRSVGDAWW